MVGLDLGISSLVILSTGEKIGNPHFFRRDEKKLARAQRRLANKRKASPETPYDSSRGVLAWLALSPSCDGASCKVYKTLKPTNSDAQDVDVSEHSARLSFVNPLACDLRPFPHAAPRGSQAREESGVPALGCSSHLTALRVPVIWTSSHAVGEKRKCPTHHVLVRNAAFIPMLQRQRLSAAAVGNREKARRIHARTADKRRDYQHKLSTRLIRENQVICVESLAIKHMLQNHSRARAIADVGWSELLRQLEYKSRWYGRVLRKIDRFEPSSKRCFTCKHLLDDLDLSVREWVCPSCGTFHDRDTNAANNIRAAGLAVYTACGEGARPVRALSPSGTSRRSRKSSS
jgi:IS605 OrfB family transposase